MNDSIVDISRGKEKKEQGDPNKRTTIEKMDITMGGIDWCMLYLLGNSSKNQGSKDKYIVKGVFHLRGMDFSFLALPFTAAWQYTSL